MKIITWNCRSATIDSSLWDYFLELDPDIALLQDVKSVPEKVSSVYDIYSKQAMGKEKPQQFDTAILAKGKGSIGEEIILKGTEDWVNNELKRFSGNLVARKIIMDNETSINAISVYSPARPVDPDRIKGIDTSNVRLTENKDVWVADLLWTSLKHLKINLEDSWVVAGDFNLSETFDHWTGGPRGNREYLDRMAKLGFTECLKSFQNKLTPSFRNSKNGKIEHQTDHLFVNYKLAKDLDACNTGLQDRVFNRDLSDHLPIIAEFK